MGLPKRHHSLKFRMPEYIGISLIVLLIAISIASFGQLTKLNWVKTKAHIIGVTKPTEVSMLYSPISSTSNGVSVLYEFQAGSKLVRGRWSSNWLSTPIVKVLAPDLVNTIEEVKSIHIGVVPDVAAEDLVAKTGMTQASAASEISKSLRGENFNGVSSVRRKSLGGIIPTEVTRENLSSVLDAGVKGPDKSSSALLGMNREIMQAPPEIDVRFDPNDPSKNTLNYPGFNLQIPVVFLNLLMFGLTFLYFVRTYPSLKLRGY